MDQPLHLVLGVSLFSMKVARRVKQKKCSRLLLSIMEAEDDYVELHILLQKMADSAALTQCTNN